MSTSAQEVSIHALSPVLIFTADLALGADELPRFSKSDKRSSGFACCCAQAAVPASRNRRTTPPIHPLLSVFIWTVPSKSDLPEKPHYIAIAMPRIVFAIRRRTPSLAVGFLA